MHVASIPCTLLRLGVQIGLGFCNEQCVALHPGVGMHETRALAMPRVLRFYVLAFAVACVTAIQATPLRAVALALVLYVTSILGFAAMRCIPAGRKAAAWRLRSGLEASGSVEVAEAAIASGTRWLLVCGGECCRDVLGARLGAKLAARPDALAFFSSGHFKFRSDFSSEARKNHRQHFAGIDMRQLQEVMELDREAIDTFANFTTFLRCIERKGLARERSAPVDVVVVTSSYHLPRAWAIASLVLGFAGLSFHVAEAPSQSGDEEKTMARRSLREGPFRCARDVLRAFVWLLSGFEGDALAGVLHQNRRAFRAWYREHRE
ncbi:unnamed protein product [Symbiodinium natans]|uniref:DUF218 domain-containing protein n=1 Tax=Symbiodinium natans TaxID=878477 RepID=A0A812P901_9DINO|nr:unnamed protein product [Symbiodinium natans]